MKRLIVALVVLTASLLSSHTYAQLQEDVVACGFSLVGRSQAMGGEFTFYASVVGIRFNLNLGFCGIFSPSGNEKMFCYAELSLGYNFYIPNRDGFSNIYAMVGYRSFPIVINKEACINPNVLNTITAHIGYIKFFNDHIGINAGVVMETYSIHRGNFIRTYKNFADGIVGSCGVIYKF